MKPGFVWKSLIFANAFLVVMLAFLLAGHVPLRPRRALVEGTNNPNSFCLWKNETGITYNFRYDPHAADAWRFKAAPELRALVQSARAESTRTNPAP